MKAARRPLKRPNMRRAVILFPSGFTLGNLFFGVFAIIAASRLEFTTAGVYVMLGGICDALDGRVARATNSGTQFGEELDSLVDAVTFGLAPAMIMYFAVLNRDGWDWIFVFLFCACAVLRLARFNIEQAGTAKTYFQGLPSPAAGITLASYYWFSQSWLYTYGAIGDLPWHKLLRFIMAGLAMLMISNVPYPNFPRTGFRSVKAALASLLLVTCAVLFFWVHRLEFFFPLALIYVAWGLFRWVFFGLFERRQPTVPYDLSEGEDEEDEEEFDVEPSTVHAERGHRRAEPAPKPERGRGRGESSERPERTARPPREAKPPRESRAVRPDLVERADRADVADVGAKAERPQRTEAERAARREKREKRDKREEGRSLRPIAAVSEAPVLTMATDAVTVPIVPTVTTVPERPDAHLAITEGDEEVVGTITSGSDAESGSALAATGRKRKRRRRRGSRDRDGSRAAGSDGEASGDDDSTGDTGGDATGDGEGTRSPYAERAPRSATGGGDVARVDEVVARPYIPPLPAPTAAPQPLPVTPPLPDSSP